MKKSKLKTFFKKIIKNEPLTAEINIFIPYKIIIPVVLILMALTGKVGATIAIWIAAFLVFIFLLPDDL